MFSDIAAVVFALDDKKVGFPDPSLAEPDGLLAVGGGMTPEWLLNAYYFGIFPWYEEDGVPYWYSPSRRMVLKPSEFRLSKSLRRLLRSGRMEVRVDTRFREVMQGCATVERAKECGETWITRRFIDAYCALHEKGFAHSFETYLDGELVGGLYGVSIADYFCGESMFHKVTDASKVAFAKMVEFAQMHGFRFVDAQLYTSHLASLGAKEITRDEFQGLLAEQDLDKTYRGKWKCNSVVLLMGGNQGDRVALLLKAIAQTGSRIGTVVQMSPIYETEPWGFEAEQNFLNIAVVVDTDLSAHEVLEEALQIEKELGRIRKDDDLVVNKTESGIRNYSSRPIDIDLIFYNSEIIDLPDLQVPHPRMHQRRFVLTPLADIIPDICHPKFGKTIRQMLSECVDKGAVEKYFC